MKNVSKSKKAPRLEAKTNPSKITFLAKYRKGVLTEKSNVMKDAKNSHKIELMEQGKTHGDGDFVTVRIFVKDK